MGGVRTEAKKSTTLRYQMNPSMQEALSYYDEDEEVGYSSRALGGIDGGAITLHVADLGG
ncbi:hypothetical protein CEN46_26050 [Fischerella thermalis CCMEE 5318]|uniref:Uncharacterized protein n=1 Tax=Fischerella thermalis CCMEE 5318 TaxID=2019666 RepID=A0A2N6L453_9CYAN|nr:hypothetical protein CEN46_26050 [Fischerella thermalis CCMEE 5318]